MSPTDYEVNVQTEQLQRQEKEAPPAAGSSAAGQSLAASAPRLSTDLSFACALIPRFSDHYLAGDITECLVDWMKEICISYGWRLDAIAVRPGYLQWVMTVPLNANPAHFIKLVRQHTSLKIFEDFPRFKQKNLSGQFWAPGSLVTAGDQLLAAEAINQFILQTRQQQGLA